jgi:hypothetical protein
MYFYLFPPILVTICLFSGISVPTIALSYSSFDDIWPKYEIFDNGNLSLFISLPPDWKVNIDPIDESVSNIITVNAPQSSPYIQPGKLNIGIENLEPNTTLLEYSQVAKSVLASRLNDFELVDAIPLNISSLSGERILFTHKENNKTVQVMQIWLTDETTAYIVTFATKPSSYGYYNPILNRIVSTIDITNHKLHHPSSKPLNYTYFMSPHGFEFFYPNDWILTEGKNRLSFVSKQSGPADRYLERMDIYYNLSNSTMPISSKIEHVSLNQQLLKEIEFLMANLSNLSIASINNINNSKVHGKELLYTYDSNIGPTTVREFLFADRHNAVLLAFSTNYNEFDDISEEIQLILNSFRFLDN